MTAKRLDDAPPLDRWRIDEALEPEEPIWGLPHIALVLGLSVNTTRKLARKPEVPIYKPDGTDSYFAFKKELKDWLCAKPG